MIRFSVIMSLYEKDNPSFFKDALESVSTNQSLKPNQIVVVEDGPVSHVFDDIFNSVSADNPTIEFLLIKKETNKGLAAALNSAIDACKYEWIARMDSDDISVSSRFEKQFCFIESHPDLAVVGGNMGEFYDTIGDIALRRVVSCNHDGICKMMKKRNPMNHITVCYKKYAVVSCGKYSESFGKLEDYKLWVDMVNAGYKFGNIKDVVCYARVGDGFIERRSNKREIKDWDMLQKYLLKNKIVNKFESIMNKAYIRLFIYSPKFVKKLAYKTFLRK